jgi:RNA polymerase-binding transcription factor DksA
MAATRKPATKHTATKTSAKKAAAKPAPVKKAPAKKAPVVKATTTTKKTTTTSTKKATAKRASAPSATRGPASAPSGGPATEQSGIPAPRGTTKDGIAYTKDFDVKFLKTQHGLLIAERDALLGQANRLEDEANSLIEDGEMGDVQFDDESGEGDTMVVERERDLALSAQARQTIADIDAALHRMSTGTYGYSVVSGRPIPRERLEAIPWATVLVEEKVGGIGRR